MIVELVGPPGAGKTTVLPMLAERLQDPSRPVPVVDLRGDVLGRSLRHVPADAVGALAAPRTAAALARWLTAGKQGAVEAVRVSRRATAVRRLDGDDTLLLADEGPVQRALLAHTRCGLRYPAGALPVPDKVVRARVPAETALERVAGRGDANPTLIDLHRDRALEVIRKFEDAADRTLRGVETLEIGDDSA